MPGVLERLDLRVRLLAGRRAKQDVVVGLAVERRIEIDEIKMRSTDSSLMFSRRTLRLSP